MKDLIYKILLIIVLSSIIFFIVSIVKTFIDLIMAVGG